MKTRYDRVLFFGILGVISISLPTYFVYRAVDNGIAASIQHKSAKSAVATVVKVVPIHREANHHVSKEKDLYNVCFKINDFDAIESSIRLRYGTAESNRYTQEGPRCKETNREELVAQLKIGDRLDVGYLLENDYKIDIVSVKSHGYDL